ncbi:RNA polymerase sigma factor [Paenarthrobacter sp. NPDC056912]|uniref:RNA polymerase sigma factor n=1 Tax=Paenarthrobacter sp. NPDC056912 TaxID=3345965 RepID=UPI003670DB12
MTAFDALYERHVSIASAVAKRNVDNPGDAEDIVADAFQTMLQSLVAGKGPNNFFRAYLLSTVTRLSHHWNRKAARTLPSDDHSVLDHSLAEPDVAVIAFESHAVARAFRALPERWQAVLWYLDVERMKPAAVAPILGLTPNAVSALAVRAREGLRRQYLQAHVAEEPSGECAKFSSKLGNFIRGGLSSSASREVRGHLNRCTKCTATLSELKDVQGTMRAVLLPLVTGAPLAAWAGKSAGLGVLGGLVPVKAAMAFPVMAQPAVMAAISAAGLGLVLGAVGIVGGLNPNAYMKQPVVEATAAHQVPGVGPSAAVPAPPTTSAPLLPEPAPPAAAPGPVAVAPDPSTVEAPPSQPQPTLSPVPSSPVSPSPVSPRPVPSSPVSPSPKRAPAGESPAAVTASVRELKDRDADTAVMQVDFAAAGSKTLGSGKVVFSVGRESRIVEDALQAPDGWSCSMEGRNLATCVTDSVQRGDLHFHVTAESKRQRNGAVLTYSLSGSGLAAGEFEYKY